MKFIPKSSVIKLLTKSLVETKEDTRIFSSKKNERGPEKYFKWMIKSLKILDAFKFRTQKISDVYNFGQNLLRNLKGPKCLVINVIDYHIRKRI